MLDTRFFKFLTKSNKAEFFIKTNRKMKLTLESFELANRPPGKSMSARMQDFDTSAQLQEATLQVIATAKRGIAIYSRDLEHSLYAQTEIVEALKQFAIKSRGGLARILVQDTMAARSQPHPLLGLSQRLSSVFQFRTPIDPEDLQYPSAFIASDRDAYCFRLLDGRFEGDWSPSLPARNKQLVEHFSRVWERSRPCTEFRALGL